MNATTINTAPKTLREWWASPPRSGMRRVIWPFEYRHLRAFAAVRIAAGIALTGVGVFVLFGGSASTIAVGWAALFLTAAAASFSLAYWLLTIARSASAPV